jgi:hypothetical protein
MKRLALILAASLLLAGCGGQSPAQKENQKLKNFIHTANRLDCLTAGVDCKK